MKYKLKKIKKCAKAFGTEYGNNAIYMVLRSVATSYQWRAALFKLTHEQLFYACLWVLDGIRKGEISTEEGGESTFKYLFDQFKETAPTRTSDKNIAFAVLVSLKCAHLCLDPIVDRDDSSEYDMAMGALEQLIYDYEQSYHCRTEVNDMFFMGDFCPREFWYGTFIPHVQEYMRSDVFLSSEIGVFLDEQGEAGDELKALHAQVASLQAENCSLKAELDVYRKSDKEDDDKQMSVRQLIILFENLLNVKAAYNHINKSQFADFLIWVSGKTSVRSRIPSQGLDYANENVMRDADFVIERLAAVSPEMSRLLRERIDQRKQKT